MFQGSSQQFQLVVRDPHGRQIFDTSTYDYVFVRRRRNNDLQVLNPMVSCDQLGSPTAACHWACLRSRSTKFGAFRSSQRT